MSAGRRNDGTLSDSRNTTPSAGAIVGKGAVQKSKKAQEQQQTVTVTTEDDEAIRIAGNLKKVGAKTFYLENGVWVDSEFKEEAKLAETKLKFASDEYFDLITKEKDLAQYFALGEQVVVVWKGKIYRIMK
jgi:hypothetical protein